MEKKKFKLAISKQTIIFLGMMVAVFVALSITATGFFTWSNITNILSDMVIPAVFALGMGIIFAVGGFDLSLGHMASMAALLAAYCMSSAVYLTGFAASMVALVACAVAGAISGLVVSRLGVSSFIATLGMQFLIIGARFKITGGKSIYITLTSFKAIASRTSGGIPYLLFWLAIIALVCYIFMEKTTIGRKMQFIGSNIDASEYKGIDIRNLTLLAFVLGAVLAGLAGILMAAKAGTVMLASADSYLLDAITIAVLSKVLFGGKYKTIGIIAVAFLISMIGTGIVMLGWSSEWVIFAKGFIILIAIAISKIK
ncbi:MAG: ABC transporter permease [Bacillota bacterium]